MAVFKPRTRMVNFRLSEAEYQELRNLSVAHGARSISDFTRAAVCGLIRDGEGAKSDGEDLEATVRWLAGKVEEIDRELKRLATIIARGGISGPRKRPTRHFS